MTYLPLWCGTGLVDERTGRDDALEKAEEGSVACGGGSGGVGCIGRDAENEGSSLWDGYASKGTQTGAGGRSSVGSARSEHAHVTPSRLSPLFSAPPSLTYHRVAVHPDLSVLAVLCLLSDKVLDVPSLLVRVGDSPLAPLGARRRFGEVGGWGGERRVAKATLVERKDARGRELGEKGEVVVVAGDVLVEALSPQEEVGRREAEKV